MILNIRKTSEDFIYIGRPSKWGNPFVIGIDGNREEVINKFRTYARSKFNKSDLEELKGKNLGCYCKPLACHGDVLEEMIKEELK